MAYEIKQGNIFGRLGTGIGQGIAEQLPKEVARNRLASGLQQFEQESGNLSPMQSLARLASIPGALEHPELVRQFGELARQQGIKGAYQRKSNAKNEKTSPEMSNNPASQAIQDIRFANLPENQMQRKGTDQELPVKPEDYGQPQVVEKNPLRNEAIPIPRWTPERFNEEVGNVLESGVTQDPTEARRIASENEERQRSQPEAQQEIDKYLKQQQEEINNEFTSQLETKLQKKNAEVFSDLTGEMQENLKRNIATELKKNPNATVKDVVNKWTNKALDLAKSKKLLETLSNRSIIDMINPLKKKQTLDKLDTYQKIFQETGNSEEYYNLLKSKFNLSPQGAASKAFPLSKQSKEFTNKIYSSTPFDRTKNAIKYAIESEELLKDRNSSPLSLSREIRRKDPMFDQNAFFNQLRENMDEIGLNPRQKRELAEGESDIFVSWPDFLILPFLPGI